MEWTNYYGQYIAGNYSGPPYWSRGSNIKQQISCHASIFIHWRSIMASEKHILNNIKTRKPSYRWQTRATRKPAKTVPIRRAYTTLSLAILTCLHAFNCYCVRNPRNPEKFTENLNLWSSRSSKVIDLGANRKPICDLLLVINSNFSRICYRFRDIHG